MVKITATILLLAAIHLGRAERHRDLTEAVRLDRSTLIIVTDRGGHHTGILIPGTRILVLSSVRERGLRSMTVQVVRVLEGPEGGTVGEIKVDWIRHQ